MPFPSLNETDNNLPPTLRKLSCHKIASKPKYVRGFNHPVIK